MANRTKEFYIQTQPDPFDTTRRSGREKVYHPILNQRNELGYLSCHLQCRRCRANTRRGRCRKRSCHDDLCWVHLLHNQHIIKAPSRWRGYGIGIYAAMPNEYYRTRKDANGAPTLNRNIVVFQQGEDITHYTGETLNANYFHSRYDVGTKNTAKYAVVKTRRGEHREYLDSLCLRSAAAYANDGVQGQRAGHSRSNAELYRRGDDLYLRATTNIVHGEEILWDQHWSGRNLTAPPKPRGPTEKFINPDLVLGPFGRHGEWARSRSQQRR